MLELPQGWFTPDDVAFYRYIYQEIVPFRGFTAEVGVYRGRSLMSVADLIAMKDIFVLCVDLFDEPYWGDTATDRYDQFLATARRFGLAHSIAMVNGDSCVRAADVADGTLDFAFIDADHSHAAVAADLCAWEPKVRPGGWIGGHDYYEGGVKKAVDERYPQFEQRSQSTIWLVQKPEVRQQCASA